METIRASHRYARMSARKARLVVDLVRGQPVNRALDILSLTPKRAARFVEKVLRSAIANAALREGVDVNRLVVVDARVDEGPLLGGRPRWRPGPRGRVMPYRKRTCHIHIGLAQPPEPVMETEGAGAAAEETR